MATFRVTISTPEADLDAARAALAAAGIEPHGPGWGRRPGEAAEMVGPEIVAEVDADVAGNAEVRVREALPDGDYRVTAGPL